MNKTLRIWIYSVVITIYILFGILKTFQDIFPWGAVIIVVPIIAAEVGLYLTRHKE